MQEAWLTSRSLQETKQQTGALQSNYCFEDFESEMEGQGELKSHESPVKREIKKYSKNKALF